MSFLLLKWFVTCFRGCLASICAAEHAHHFSINAACMICRLAASIIVCSASFQACLVNIIFIFTSLNSGDVN